MRIRKYILLSIIFISIVSISYAQPSADHGLHFDSLAKRWDDGIPLGNGWLGALIWQKGDKLRLSLDRVDLWDDRPMATIDKLSFKWVINKVKANQYDSVQRWGDEPYEANAAPTKIPGAALEFNLQALGKVVNNDLDISNGLSVIKFDNGIVINNYIHAVNQVGYFGFESLPDGLTAASLLAKLLPQLQIPAYNSGKKGTTGNSVEGQGLERLGYTQGNVKTTSNSILYHQPTWNNTYYEVLVKWQVFKGNMIIGQWTISNNKPAILPDLNTSLKEPTGWPSHLSWWNEYWTRSSVSLPDPQLERQYYLEMYKFGAVARATTPPISLQAVWTADNGNLPPWKGDFHHDLNTQLSYWPGYTGNHLDLTAGYTNWLWKVKEANQKWTKNYFGVEGLNVPGVTTISGKEMGGWIQYSMSPTTAAWVAQHFYWQWKYSKDPVFLNKYCKPYFDAVAIFLKNIRVKDPVTGKNQPYLSSSPEYHDNSIRAWFPQYTNYDLSLLRNFYTEYLEILKAAGVTDVQNVMKESAAYPEFDVNSTGLTIAPGTNLDESHRHHAQLMPIYPLGNLDIDKEKDKEIINNSLRQLEKIGTRNWCGYSFTWAACIYARAKQADMAVKQLQIFASNFCAYNSFHLNGDQKNGQYSSFTYRPFTLEGNFAFAQGVHELLIQSKENVVEVFPAIPDSWKDVSFKTLRTEGAFLVSAKKESGVIDAIRIVATENGLLNLKFPFKTWIVEGIDRSEVKFNQKGIATLSLKKGQSVLFKNGYE